MQKLLNKLTKKDAEPTTAELRELILRLERDEAMESSSAQTCLWAKEKEKKLGEKRFLAANMPPLKRKSQALTKASILAS